MAFVSRMQVPKPRLKGILLMIAAGLILLVIMILSIVMKDSAFTLFGVIATR